MLLGVTLGVVLVGFVAVAYAHDPEPAEQCPSDMVRAGTHYCIDVNNQTATGGKRVTWGEASANCNDRGKRLCTMHEFHVACVHNQINIDFQNQEFVDGTPAWNSFSTVIPCDQPREVLTQGQAYFRCCANITPDPAMAQTEETQETETFDLAK